MAQIKDILIKVFVETAKAKRKCWHKPKKHSILGGQVCLVVKGDLPNQRSCYCTECAIEILEKAQTKLVEIRSQF